MTAEILAALYDVAQKCDVCREHVATQATRLAVCDRRECVEVLVCVACEEWTTVPRDGSAPCCAACDCGEVRRVPRSTAWRDLPHAAALRAANAAHEALR